jgi:hydroxymethylpyrimidine/phosphomethylpyrimidine kinase
MPRTTLLTPNADELAKLAGCAPISTEAELEAAANTLCARYNCAILAKGGHVGGATCTDILVQPGKPTLRWTHPRTEGISTHGTGCTLSSAVAAFLAKGQTLEQAVENGLNYIANAIATSHKLGDVYAVNHSI